MASAVDLLKAMDDDGVTISVVMGIGWTDHGLARESNDYIVESVRRSGGRLVGFAGVNPAWGERAAREADRCARSGLRGIGELHPDTQGFDLGDHWDDGAPHGGRPPAPAHRDDSLLRAGGTQLSGKGQN